MSGTFADRTNAIFAALGEPAKTSGWRLDTAQGFKPGAEDALDRDSSDEAEEAQEPESLLGADDSDEEQTYRLKASSCYRRAFEREEEEDEFDRVAAGGSAQEQRPARSMEVLEDNIFDRMHSQSYRAASAAASQEPANAAVGRQQPMDLDEEPPPLEPAAGQHINGQQQDDAQGQQPKRQKPSGQLWVPPHRRPDHRPHETAAEGDEQLPSSHQQQQQGRRVRFAEANARAAAGDHQQQLQEQLGRGRGSRGGGRARGGRRGQGFVPDYVRNPQSYTVYTLDEPIYVGRGDRDAQEMQMLHRGTTTENRGGRGSCRPGAADMEAAAAADDPVDHGRWQDAGDEAPMTLDTAAPASTADVDGTAAAESIRELPAAGMIKFQPSSKRAKTQKPVGTFGESQVELQQGAGPRAQACEPQDHVTAVLDHTAMGAFVEDQTQDAEPAVGVSMAATLATAAHGKGSRHRNYRRKPSTEQD